MAAAFAEMKKWIEPLARARIAAGLSHADIGRALGVNGAVVARWEGYVRAPTGRQLARWAIALGYRLIPVRGHGEDARCACTPETGCMLRPRAGFRRIRPRRRGSVGRVAKECRRESVASG